jgi:phage terminase large subunit-like protein
MPATRTKAPPPATRSTGISPSAPASRTEPDAASDYARAVLAGEIVAGRLVRLACARHLRDLEEGRARGLIWSPAHANHAIRFFRFLKHSKGERGGDVLELAPWQKFIVGSVHGWLRADGPKKGARRFKTALLVIAKKNGKSTMCGGFGLHGLIGDREPGAEIYAIATKKAQAKQVFEPARQMVLKNPLLMQRLEPLQTAIVDRATASTFQPLSADTGGADGINPHVAIVDELHRHKTATMLNLMAESMDARRQPILWIITTASDDRPGTPYAQEEDYATKVLEGTFADDSYFAYLALLDKDDDWADEKNWIKANPNLGVSIAIEDLRDRANKAKGKPDALADFKRLRLNIRTAAQNRAIDMGGWAALKAPPRDAADLAGRKCYAGFDGSTKIDISAFVRVWAPAAKGGKWTIKGKYWLPAENVAERGHRDRAPYPDWVEKKLIEPSPGNVIDFQAIEDEIEAAHKAHPFEALAYDPYGSTQMMTSLMGKGVPVFEFGQTVKNYAPATKEFEALLQAGMLEHDGDPVLAWMAANLHWWKDGKDNKQPHKGNSTGRIDGMSALIMAIGRAIAPAAGNSGPSWWETAA